MTGNSQHKQDQQTISYQNQVKACLYSIVAASGNMGIRTFSLRGRSYEATESQLFKVFSIAIDDVLGENISSLIFKTAYVLYDTDYTNTLPQMVDSFQHFLTKTLGKKTSAKIIDSAVSQMQEYKTCRNPPPPDA